MNCWLTRLIFEPKSNKSEDNLYIKNSKARISENFSDIDNLSEGLSNENDNECKIKKPSKKQTISYP